jgi:predicted DNA-binding transcriptional regulator AlpA
MPRRKKPPQAAPVPLKAGAVLLTTREAAELTKLSIAWFEHARWARKGPPFIRTGRVVRYVQDELLQWFAQHRVSHASDK